MTEKQKMGGGRRNARRTCARYSMIDIAMAQALSEKVRARRAWWMAPTDAQIADTITALLDEVERLNSPVVLSEWQKLVAERDALARDAATMRAVLDQFVTFGYDREIAILAMKGITEDSK